ncbi:MAG: single-stranded DNA-binding protein [Chloroflexota bacterium]|jgi:single-strand DNA-binding protein
MSKQYNKTAFVGHLGMEPEMRYTPSGTAVTSFNVASNDQYTNEKGEVTKTTTWFRCTAWGKQAEVCSQYLHKGSKVLIEGRLTPDKATGRPRIWVRQDGTAAADYELKVLEIHFLDGRNNEAAIAQADPVEDDIPY